MAHRSSAKFERVNHEISVERLVAEAGIALTRDGDSLTGTCPFHDNAGASLVLTPSTNHWQCSECGVDGTSIDWVMRLHRVSRRHALELLNEYPAVLAAPERKRRSGRILAPPIDLHGQNQALLDQVANYYHSTLKTQPGARAYLVKLGLTDPDLVTHFKLGYANRSLGLRLPEKNRKEGAEIRARLLELGVYRETGHEHLNGCLIVPVFDGEGHVVDLYGQKLLDHLRPGTAYQLSLPGPRPGVWNASGLASGEGEAILCTSVIDALTFWCAGYRNVTATYGTETLTPDLLTAFRRQRILRVLIVSGCDSPSTEPAKTIAMRLHTEGFAVWRMRLPRGMNANQYALQVAPACRSLGVLIRKAQWMGDGHETRPLRPNGWTNLHAEEPASTSPCTELSSSSSAPLADTPLPARLMPTAPPQEMACEVTEQEVVLHFGEGDERRRWRVRGLPKNLAIGVLKVNVLVSRVPLACSLPSAGSFHVDTLDLYAARARAVFVQQAANELKVPETALKTDLGRVLLKLEALQDDCLRGALHPTVVAPSQMSEDDRDAALALLRAPNLPARILADFESCGAVGEATNMLTAYLAATSRLLERPLAVIIQSASAAGKTRLMDAVLAFMPPEAAVRYSSMSGQALFYMGSTDLKHKVLALAEQEGGSRASYALKLLQSDGDLTMASTGTDANGNLITREYRVEGPVSLFTTTSAIDVDEELLNRCLLLSLDEGREQTASIQRRQRERRTLAGLRSRESLEALLSLHRNAQRLLRPLAVVNPYADRLSFPDDRTRARRDHEKYLSLIDTVALLHQYQRSVKTLSVAGRHVDYIEVTPADIAQANALAHEVLGRSLERLPAQTRRLLVLVGAFVSEEAVRQGLPRTETRFSRRELRDAIGWGDTQLKVHLARLADLEYLMVHRNSQGGYGYELLYDGDGQIEPHLSGLIDPASLGYDDARSGKNLQKAAPRRDVVSSESAPRQPDQARGNPYPTSPNAELTGFSNHAQSPVSGNTPYATLVVPSAAAGV